MQDRSVIRSHLIAAGRREDSNVETPTQGATSEPSPFDTYRTQFCDGGGSRNCPFCTGAETD
jgi:CDGSH-type Zn-finger protein